MTEPIFLTPDTITCESCGLLQVQPPDSGNPGLQAGDSTDLGWFCWECVEAGMKMSRAESEDYWAWQAFEEDYPEYAAELKRLREGKGQG